MPADWTRRQILAAAGASAATLTLPGRVAAFGTPSMLDIADLVIPGTSVHRPGAWKRLLFEVIQTTSVEASPVTVEVEPENPALFERAGKMMGQPGVITVIRESPPMPGTEIRVGYPKAPFEA